MFREAFGSIPQKESFVGISRKKIAKMSVLDAIFYTEVKQSFATLAKTNSYSSLENRNNTICQYRQKSKLMFVEIYKNFRINFFRTEFSLNRKKLKFDELRQKIISVPAN